MGPVPSHTREIGPHSWFRNFPSLYSSNNVKFITVISRVDTSPHGLSTPTLVSYSWLVEGFDPI